jgi:hypothetical protein
VDRIVAWDHDREADRQIAGDRDSHPAVVDKGLRQDDRVRIGRELRAIFLPDVGGSALQRLKDQGLRRQGVTDSQDLTH